MTRPPGRCVVAAFLAAVVSAPPSSGASPAVTVSPGELERSVEVRTSCPTFSWGAVSGAMRFELVVLDLGASEEQALVWRREVAGSASTWTPSSADCLAPGGEYGWTVRALDASGTPLGDAAGWAALRRFTVPELPSEAELAAALETLRRWQAGGQNSGPSSAGQRTSPRSDRGLSSKAVEASGTSAIRGENPAVAGASHGVWGQTSSASGGGLVGVNLAGGPDLVLDGAAQGQDDTHLTQDGIDRPAAGSSTFNIQNSGAGAMKLFVDGLLVDTEATPIGWSRLFGIPAGFADGIDNDTLYAAGNQLELAGTTFNVLEGPGSGLDADTLDGAQGTSFQARVTGTCPLGQAVQGVNADGSVVCYEVPVPPRITTVDDPANGVGQYTSLAIGTNGFPVISYYDETAGALRVMWCNDSACSGNDEAIVIVDDPPANIVGLSTSIAIESDGLPVVSYHDTTADALKVAKCTTSWCGSRTITTVDDDPVNSVGMFTSLALGTDTFPVIAYYDSTAFSLKVAKCNNLSCSTRTLTTVDDPVNHVGIHPSIAIGTDGFPVISYNDYTVGALKVAHCTDASCSTRTISVIDLPDGGFVGEYSSIAIGTDGFPVISYFDGANSALKVAKCNDIACLGFNETVTTVDNDGTVGLDTSIAIGTDGFPVISYFDGTAFALKVAKCNDAACAGADESLSRVDDPLEAGRYSSVAVGTDGFPVISYWDIWFNTLKVAKCKNASCSY